MSTPKSTALTERQLDLITRAHLDSNGLIEPLLKLKGGAKLKMIASLSQRGLIAQVEGQWRLTPTAVAIAKGEAPPVTPISPTLLAATDSIAADLEIEAAVSAAGSAWKALKNSAGQRQLKGGDDGKPRTRPYSKQATVIEMLQRPDGTTIAQICEVTGWLPHTVRGTMAGALKKKLGLIIVSKKIDGTNSGLRVYRIEQGAQ